MVYAPLVRIKCAPAESEVTQAPTTTTTLSRELSPRAYFPRFIARRHTKRTPRLWLCVYQANVTAIVNQHIYSDIVLLRARCSDKIETHPDFERAPKGNTQTSYPIPCMRVTDNSGFYKIIKLQLWEFICSGVRKGIAVIEKSLHEYAAIFCVFPHRKKNVIHALHSSVK